MLIPPLDVKRLRGILKVSQTTFAYRFGIPVEVIRDWEKGRDLPSPPEKILLYLICRMPESVAFEITVLRRERTSRTFPDRRAVEGIFT